MIALSHLKAQIFKIIQPSAFSGRLSRAFHLFLMVLISLNVAIVFAYTFPLSPSLITMMRDLELFSVITFTAEYLLRLWTADLLFPTCSPSRARLRYIRSGMAIIDLLAIVPFYLPMLFPFDLKVLRAVRLIRLFQLVKLIRYITSLLSIVRVIRKKSSQLLSSLVVVMILITISSILMYSVENPAQPTVFDNAFSGMWWAISTLTTVGYGDIYPITAPGKVLGSVIAFLGIGLLAVPTAIISSGFMEQSKSKWHDIHVADLRYCPHCGKKLP